MDQLLDGLLKLGVRGVRLGQASGDAKVGDDHVAIRADKHVVRLEVPIDDGQGMNVAEGRKNLCRDEAGGAEAKPDAEVAAHFTSVWQASGDAAAAQLRDSALRGAAGRLLEMLAPPFQCRGVRRAAKGFARAFDAAADDLRGAVGAGSGWAELRDAVDAVRRICK